MEDLSSFWPEPKSRFSPVDNLRYHLTSAIVEFTIDVLRSYKNREGVVYWAGKRSSDEFSIYAAVAPKIQARKYNFSVDHAANAAFVSFICDNNLTYISQVHSHPGIWVDHSEVDDTETAFRRSGLISIVVPEYGRTGMLPLEKCGVHRFHGDAFERLSDDYVIKHFKVEKVGQNTIVKDFRNG